MPLLLGVLHRVLYLFYLVTLCLQLYAIVQAFLSVWPLVSWGNHLHCMFSNEPYGIDCLTCA